MRVLHVIESLAAAGAEQVLLNLLPYMQSAGVHCEVVALHAPYTLAAEFKARGIAVHELDLSWDWNLYAGFRGLRRVMGNRNFDLIHSHLPLSVFYVAMAKRFVPHVVTLHGLSFEHYPPDTLPKKLHRQLETWWTNHRTTAFIAVSTAVANHYHEVLNVPLETIRIIPNGFPPEQFTRDHPLPEREFLRAHLGWEPDDFAILHVGRFAVQKGQMYLLQASLELKRRNFKFKLLLVGDGPRRSAADRFIQENGLSGSVRIQSAVAHADLPRFLRISDVFVFPSVSEGFGMAAGEAMCAGLPVVASDLPGIASLIDHRISGLLVRPADPIALADAIQEVHNKPELRYDLAKNAYVRMVNDFRADAIALRIVEFYRSLVVSEGFGLSNNP